jgi:tetratricopeptide (TPR) repeat protein
MTNVTERPIERPAENATTRPIDPERARKRRRAILGLVSLPFTVAAVVVAVYLFSLSTTAGLAIGYYADGAYSSSKAQASKLVDHNLVETWLPYFDRGDAKAGAQEYTAAVDDFEKALTLAPEDRKCEVRVNLAQTWTTLGDIYERGGYHQGAVLLYQAAKDVIAAAGNECPPNTAGAQALGQLEQGLEGKQQQAQNNQQQQDAQNPDSGQSQLDQLGQEQQQGEQQKQNDDARDQGSGSGNSAAKPW